jgi:hypothetical protein
MFPHQRCDARLASIRTFYGVCIKADPYEKKGGARHCTRTHQNAYRTYTDYENRDGIHTLDHYCNDTPLQGYQYSFDFGSEDAEGRSSL